MDASVAGEIEQAFARAGHLVVSNSRNHRMDADVPLLIPEVNGDHLALIEAQRKARGWTGAIVTNPNCSTVVLSLALAPLRPFGLTLGRHHDAAGALGRRAIRAWPRSTRSATSSRSSTARKPRSRARRRRSSARLVGGHVEPHPVVVSAQTTRVPVVNGHTESIAVALESRPIDRRRSARRSCRSAGRRSATACRARRCNPIVYLAEQNRPQPRLDVDRDGGMTVSVGRLRPCPVLGYKFVALGHNTVRGAAGAAVLNAELMVAEGVLVVGGAEVTCAS